MQKIIYTNPKNLEKILENMKKEGLEKLHILADFDRTLTKTFINGKKRHSLIHSMEEKWYLGKEFSKEYKQNFEYYYPIEIDPNIFLEEKNKHMEEWWINTNKLLIKNNLNKNDIRKIVNNWNIEFREWVKEFLDFLKQNSIPLIIISASWLWVESIKYFFEENNVFYDNIYIISNDFVWDKDWKAINYKTPVIHTFNKWETILKEFPEIYEKIQNRKNVILLWDSLWDHHMIDWFDYKNLVKIWFLNEKEDELIQEYQKRYDIVITWDWDFGEVNRILKNL